MTNAHQYYDRKLAAQWLTAHGLDIKPATLAKYMTIGGGPLATKWGRFVRYREDHLQEWVQSRLHEVAHSSDAGRAA